MNELIAIAIGTIRCSISFKDSLQEQTCDQRCEEVNLNES